MRSPYQNKGFSLIEVIIGIALFSAISLAMMRLFDSQSKAQKKLSQNFTVLQVAEEVGYILNDALSCTKNLNGHSLNETLDKVSFFTRDLTTGDSNEQYIIARVNDEYGEKSQGKVKLSEIKLVHNTENLPDEDPDIPNSLKMTFKKASTSFGGENIFFQVPVRVLVDENKKIESCFVTEDQFLKNLCENLLKGFFYEADRSCRSVSFQSETEDQAEEGLRNFGVKVKGKVLIKGDLRLGSEDPNGGHVLFDSVNKTLDSTKLIKVGNMEMNAGCEDEQNPNNCVPTINGIGTLYADKIIVNNDIEAAGIWYTSDEREKSNISAISADLIEKVLSLTGVSFQWKNAKDQKSHYGFIAQDVEKVLPEIVSKNKKTGLRSISYHSLISPLLEIVKKQSKDIEKLEAKMESLQHEK